MIVQVLLVTQFISTLDNLAIHIPLNAGCTHFINKFLIITGGYFMPYSSTLYLSLLGIIFAILFSRITMQFMINITPKKIKKNNNMLSVSLLVFNIMIVFITFLLSYFIPKSIIYMAFISPFLSVYFWLVIKYSIKGTVKHQIKVSLLGQSFFLLLVIIFIILLINPIIITEHSNQDNFMIALGFLTGLLGSFFALLIGFIVFLIPKPKRIRNITN